MRMFACHRKTRWLVVAFVLSIGFSGAALAEVLVIGNQDSGVGSLGEDQVAALYLGKVSKLPDGTVAEVIDLPAGSPVRVEFFKKILHKTEKQMRAYWAKRVFTGKGTPPATVSDEEAVVEWVAAGKGRIGYVSGATATDGVKVLLRKP